MKSDLHNCLVTQESGRKSGLNQRPQFLPKLQLLVSSPYLTIQRKLLYWLCLCCWQDMDSKTWLVRPIIQLRMLTSQHGWAFSAPTTFCSGASSNLQHSCKFRQTETRWFAQNGTEKHTKGLNQTLLRVFKTLLPEGVGLQNERPRRTKRFETAPSL